MFALLAHNFILFQGTLLFLFGCLGNAISAVLLCKSKYFPSFLGFGISLSSYFLGVELIKMGVN